MKPKSFQLIAASLCLLVLAGCKTELYTDLGEREANEMVAILLNAGIKASKSRDPEGTYTLSLDESDFAVSMEILSRLGYPEERFNSYEDIYKGNRLVSSPSEERTRLSFATNQELSRTISDIDGVAKARVHIVLPEITPLGEVEGKPTAAVSVHFVRGTDPSPLIPVIKRIVSHSVQDLRREDVTIAFFETSDLSIDPIGESRVQKRGGYLGFLSSFIGWLLAVTLLIAGVRLIFSDTRDRGERSKAS